MKKILFFLLISVSVNAQISTKCAVCPPSLKGVADGSVLRDSSGYARWQSVAGFDTSAIGVDLLGKLFWNIHGNSGTNPATAFLGTTDGAYVTISSGKYPDDANNSTNYSLFQLSKANDTVAGGFSIVVSDSINNQTQTINTNQGSIGIGQSNIVGDSALSVLMFNDSFNVQFTPPTGYFNIYGQLKLQDGTQANGYVLTSDANGLASWQRGLTTLYSQTDTIQIINDSLERSIVKTGTGTFGVSANSLVEGNVLTFQVGGFHSNNSGANLIVRIKMDGAVIDSATIGGIGTTNTGASLNVKMSIYTTGVSGTYWINGSYTEDGVGSTGLIRQSAQTIDTTIPHTFDITLQWSRKSATNQWFEQTFTLDKR